jgi:nucleoside-diphosphate-sugar epimerase
MRFAPFLVTGSEGLVGEALAAALRARGHAVGELDLRSPRASDRADVRDRGAVARAVAGCNGVVHLAAVSRVVWGEQDPAQCWSTNVDGTRVVLDVVMASRPRPWVIFASSREVYGQARSFPVTEDAPLQPMNVYGRTKVVAEKLVEAAKAAGLRAAVVRLSNVYGSTRDHADRVVPAFARGALAGDPLRVDGADSTFDFTHVDDVADALVRMVHLLAAGQDVVRPIHLVTSVPTTLGELAHLAVELAGGDAGLEHHPPRAFDVGRFVGDPRRAREILDWQPRVSLRQGLARLIDELRLERRATPAKGAP